MAHDFKRFPELTNRQMQIYYFESPHKQVVDDFTAKVVKVHDGDTVRLEWTERDFTFPLRMSNLAAPELNEEGGKASQSWLEGQLLGEIVDIRLSKQRVEKWGRLLGSIIHRGINMSDATISNGTGVPWEQRKEGKFPNINFIFERQ